ncbi:MAG TPA: PLP-dependent transferase, partial [Spirochaetota bacterium]|nr:PLP-dependent transferase [Spirochaetota bacterium]
MLKSDKNFGINTLSIHAGEGPDSRTGASAPNVVMSTTFVLDEAGGSFSALSLTDEAPYVYTRFANPTADQLERKTAKMERGEAAVAYSTGMAATVSLWL